MDQITSKSSTQMCIKHSSKQIEFVQVNNLSQSQNEPLFYCTACINKDLQFKGLNYLLISQIIEEGETNIIQKWPPVNDYFIIEKLIQFTESQDSSHSVIHQINLYFTQLKEEFLHKVDLCEKKMINRALKLPLGKESIVSQYKDISQIAQLRQMLNEGQKMDAQVHQENCRKFITEIESQKQQKSEQLQNLLEQCSRQEQLTNFEQPKLIKDSIFSFIDSIDFFTIEDPQSIIDSTLSANQNNSYSRKIMKLISNKSNYCSDSFLSSIQHQLDKVNLYLSNISFENMHKQNQSPINFEGFSDMKMDMIKEFAEHQTKIEQNREYSQNVEQSFEYKHLEAIIDSNVNFVNNNLKQQLKKYLVDTYPLLKQINFSNPTVIKEKYDCFRLLSNQEIEDMFQLIKKKQQLTREDDFNLSQTKSVYDLTQHLLTDFTNIPEILRSYPIFDLMKLKQENLQQIKVQLTKTKFTGGENRVSVENNKIKITNSNYVGNNNYYSINCVSDIVLEKDKKYIFRFSIETTRQDLDYLLFGLIEQAKIDTDSGYNNYLSCYLKYQNGSLEHIKKYGIDTYLKGNTFKLSKENMIEMRVWRDGGQLEILDYPNKQFKIGLDNKNIQKLKSDQDLKLYIGMKQDNISVTLLQSYIVDHFLG